VPLEITPEIFWSRYFFKVMLINRNGALDLNDEDDEEELQWEDSSSSTTATTTAPAATSAVAAETRPPANNLAKDNEVLRGQVSDVASTYLIVAADKTMSTRCAH
jgi:hypothetical protein